MRAHFHACHNYSQSSSLSQALIVILAPSHQQSAVLVAKASTKVPSYSRGAFCVRERLSHSTRCQRSFACSNLVRDACHLRAAQTGSGILALLGHGSYHETGNTNVPYLRLASRRHAAHFSFLTNYLMKSHKASNIVLKVHCSLPALVSSSLSYDSRPQHLRAPLLYIRSARWLNTAFTHHS